MQIIYDHDAASTRAAVDRLKDYPVREYVAALARELATLARFDGDEALGKLLDGAAEAAERPWA